MTKHDLRSNTSVGAPRPNFLLTSFVLADYQSAAWFPEQVARCMLHGAISRAEQLVNRAPRDLNLVGGAINNVGGVQFITHVRSGAIGLPPHALTRRV